MESYAVFTFRPTSAARLPERTAEAETDGGYTRSTISVWDLKICPRFTTPRTRERG